MIDWSCVVNFIPAPNEAMPKNVVQIFRTGGQKELRKKATHLCTVAIQKAPRRDFCKNKTAYALN